MLSLATGAAATLAAATPAAGQSVDALLDLLVRKGVLTSQEAGELRPQAQPEFATAFAARTGMPDWVTAFKINGDFRGRYENFFSSNDTFVQRTRFRYRARLGFTAVLKENLEVGLRLASGDVDNAASITSGANPLSLNQTLQNNASKKGVFMDLAYLKWSPWITPALSSAFTFGKMPNPGTFTPMIYDVNYTPEGGALQLSCHLGSQHTLSLASGAFVLDEIASSSSDPFMLNNQVALKSTWSKTFNTSCSAASLWIRHVGELSNSSVPNWNGGNTRVIPPGSLPAAAYPKYNFNPVVLDGSATYNLAQFPLYPGCFPITVGGEYMVNPGAPAQDWINGVHTATGNFAYNLGVAFGKASQQGTWEINYTWRYLGANSWYEEMTGNDFGAYNQYSQPGSDLKPGYTTGTNVKGHIVRLSYAPFNMLVLNATYFLTHVINEQLVNATTTWDSQMNRIQLDAVVKF